MADSKIPLSDLPAGVPGAYDKVAGVDTATGASRLFPMPQAGVPRSYATRASLPAAGTLPEGTSFTVNNDPNIDMNGLWAVLGGVWVQSADRTTALQIYLDETVDQINADAEDLRSEIRGESALIDAGVNQIGEAISSGGEIVTVTESSKRIHSPLPAAEMVVTPEFAGKSATAAVTPIRVTVTGKNIVDADPDLWEVGQIDASGNNSASTARLRTIGHVAVAPSTTYAVRCLYIVVVSLYTAAGVFTRQLTNPTSLTTAANEGRMRLAFSLAAAKPTDAEEAGIQVEAGGTTPYEPYRSAVKVYSPAGLYAHGAAVDTISGNTLTRATEQREIVGEAGGGKFGITNNVGPQGAFYRAALSDGFRDRTKEIIAARSSDGDYALAETTTTQARSVYARPAGLAYITVEQSKIDAMPGANLLAKFRAYLDAYPVDAVFDLGSYATTQQVSTGLLLLPENGSVLVEATGTTDYTVNFREVASGGGGGGGMDSRLSAVEGDVAALNIDVPALQDQVDALVVSGDSSVEAAQARTSATGLVAATLKARLDRMESNAGIVDVRDFGAVGNGVADDTDAIRAARDVAESLNMTLHFSPCSVAYMVRGGIRLHKNTRVTGHPLGRVKKFPAYTTAVTAMLTVGQTVIPVTNASGFVVGQDIYIGPTGTTTTYSGTRGVITAVNTVANTITIAAYNSASGGMRAAYAAASGILASSTFPILYTDNIVTPGVVIAPEIVGVHLDGNKQPGEANAYPCSLIHLDHTHTEGSLVTRCILRNSGADGLSDQGNGRSIIAFNRLYDNNYHGIHIGFTSHGQQVLHNYVYGSGQDGVYYCFNNRETVTFGNFIENCPIGFAEIDSSEGDTVLSGNITKNCGTDYQVIGADGVVQIVGFLSLGSSIRVVTADSTRKLRIQGVAKGGTGVGVDLTRVGGGSVDVDFYDWAGLYCVSVSNINATRSSKVRISGTFNGGANTRPILVQSSDKVLVNDFIFDCGGTYDVVINAGSGQAASDGTVIGVGIRNKGISDGGTNTVGV